MRSLGSRLIAEIGLSPNKYRRLKRLLAAGDFSVSSELHELENRLKDLISKELSGVLFRSKARWLEERERPTCFFFRIERESIQRNFISSVLNSDDEVFSSEEIEREHVRFYSDFFLLNLLMLVVSKLVWPVLKNTYLLHNNNHARGFYRSKNSPILLKASTLANHRALTAFPLNSIYIFGRFWVLFSSASLTNVFAMETCVTL